MREQTTVYSAGKGDHIPMLSTKPTSPLISLTDAIQVDFDHARLDLETDLNLYRLLARAEDAIDGWNRLGRAMMHCEIDWYNSLHTLADSIKKTLNTRYGCND